MITAKELREQLKNIPDDTPIILQTDDDGNGYRYINRIDFESDGDKANMFDGEECVRAEDIDGEYDSSACYTLVAVVF